MYLLVAVLSPLATFGIVSNKLMPKLTIPDLHVLLKTNVRQQFSSSRSCILTSVVAIIKYSSKHSIRLTQSLTNLR